MDRKTTDETGAADTADRVKQKIDVSVAQVAGSAVAAVIAALIAGRLGVYGTFIGAGLISVVATTGGPVFQHFFRRTGEQVKDVTVAAAPRRVRRTGRGTVVVAAGTAPETLRETRGQGPAGEDATSGTVEATRLLPQVTRPTPRTDPSADGGTGPQAVRADEDPDSFGAASTHGSRRRRWKRALVPAVLVFAVSMGGITVYEMVSGNNVSGGRGGTTSFSEAFHPSSNGTSDAPAPGTDPGDTGADTEGTGGTDGSGGTGEQPEQGASPDPTPGTEAPEIPGTSGADGSGGTTDGGVPEPAPTPDGTDSTSGDDGTSGDEGGVTDGGAGETGGDTAVGGGAQQPGTGGAAGAEAPAE